MKKQSGGFTLVEVMVVVVVVGLLAGVAIPSLMRSRLVSNESIVQHDLKSVAAAAEIYRSSQIPPVYPPDLDTLGKGNIPILDAAIAAGKQHGYSFLFVSNAAGDGFGCVANPLQYGATGNRSFCIDHQGILRQYRAPVKTDGSGCVNNSSLISATP